MSSKEIHNEKLEHIYRLVETTLSNVEKIKDLISKLDQDEKRDVYKNVEGTVGVFDGTYSVTTDGQKLEVPANYAAKSRICYGDTLKLIKEDGKDVFKQIDKPARKKVEGIMTKKEGKWYIISDSGTFKVSDVAADFQHAELNDEAEAFIPADNLNSPFAALDKVKKKGEQASQITQEGQKKYSEPKIVEVKRAPVSEVAPAKVAPSKAEVKVEKLEKAEKKVQSKESTQSKPAVSDEKPRYPAHKDDEKPRYPERRPFKGKPRSAGPKREFVDRIVEKAPVEKAPLPSTPVINIEDDDLR